MIRPSDERRKHFMEDDPAAEKLSDHLDQTSRVGPTSAVARCRRPMRGRGRGRDRCMMAAAETWRFTDFLPKGPIASLCCQRVTQTKQLLEFVQNKTGECRLQLSSLVFVSPSSSSPTLTE